MGRAEQQSSSDDRARSKLFLPQLRGSDSCAVALEAAAYQPAGGDRGAASRVALWGAVYLFFLSVTLHNVR